MEVWVVYRADGEYDDYRVETIAAYDTEAGADAHCKSAAAWHDTEAVEPNRNIEWELVDQALEESDRLRKRAATNPFDPDRDSCDRRTYWYAKLPVRSELPKSRLKRYLAALPS